MLQISLPVYLFVLAISGIIVAYFAWKLYTTTFKTSSGTIVKPRSGDAAAARRRNRLPQDRMRRTFDGDNAEQEGVRQRRIAADNTVDDQLNATADNDDQSANAGGKIGVKKAAKLAEKARRKEEREAEQRLREEQMKAEDERIAKRQAEEAAEEEAEAALEAAEAKKRQEEADRQQAEYERIKVHLSVEDEGADALPSDSRSVTALNNQLIDAIKAVKIITIEHLALEFNLKTETCVDKLKQLLASNQLTGVLDDRGKFVYITPNEYEEVAKFIEQRGRVSLTELAQHGAKLICPEVG